MKEQLLKYITELGTFSNEEVLSIVEETNIGFFKKGTILLRENEICNQCYFVLKGCLRQYQLIDGEEKNTAFFIEEQAAVSYVSYLNSEPSKHYLTCLEDSLLIIGTRDEEQKLHQKHPKLANLVKTLMTNDYKVLEDRLSTFINQSPEERYLQLLSKQPHLFQRIPQHHLASYIGISPESFSRIRKRSLKNSKNNISIDENGSY